LIVHFRAVVPEPIEASGFMRQIGRESNSVFALLDPIPFYSVGVLGIEPNLYAPETYVLPVYYTPLKNGTGQGVCNTGILHPDLYILSLVGMWRVELQLQDPQPCVLPLYYTPKNKYCGPCLARLAEALAKRAVVLSLSKDEGGWWKNRTPDSGFGDRSYTT
jgi:hypothetical protein